MTRRLVVWQWTDGKRGHERQCEGLARALATHVALDHHLLAVPRPALRRLTEFVAGIMPELDKLPAPDLILGAGRSCGLPVLTTRRARGGRAVVCMRPQWLRASFDLCIIPRHDQPSPATNVIVTEGPLNPMQPAARRDPGLGLILLGGPSAHHTWDSRAIIAQIDAVLVAYPHCTWYVTDSRRSPATLAEALRPRSDMVFQSHRDAAPDWLPTMLAKATHAWVSADSVAMIYEALSAGALVGLLEVPCRRRDRITAIAADLRARGLVTTLPGVGVDAQLTPPLLAEAARVAEVVLTRWPELRDRQ